MRAGTLRAAIALAVAVVACEDDVATTETPDAGGTSPEAAAFIADICAAYAPCCGPAGQDPAGCAASLAARARGTTLDPARAAACLEHVRSLSSSPTFCVHPPDLAACSASFKHPRAREPGGACDKASDCANGPDGEGICLDGRCQRVVRGKSGDPCLGTHVGGRLVKASKLPAGPAAVCGALDGLHCAESGACEPRGAVGVTCAGRDTSCVDAAWCPTETHQCTARTAVTERCVEAEECAVGARCANDGEGGATCVAFAQKGEPCPRGDECDPSSGLSCASETATCREDAQGLARACRGELALF